MDKYKNKYRIASSRAQWWDYGWDASYFITICTRFRKHFFGEVRDEKMVLSPLGCIADACWREIPEHGKNVELGAHVIMPNHVHGILNLHSNAAPFRFVPAEFVDAARIEYVDEFPRTLGQIRFRNPGKNTVSSIVGGFKSAVSKRAAKEHLNFGWQSRFHDHIIRDAEEYQRVTNYILNNPAAWKKDKFYTIPTTGDEH